jgi:NADPH:quinone reductase-like Zn-dependent oxidoreductase
MRGDRSMHGRRRPAVGHRPSGRHGTQLSDHPVLQNRIAVQGISIGHRRAFERMNEAIETLAIKPVIDKVHGFDEVPRAFEHLETGPFGKIVIAGS